jgi:PAS domain S-box-containing protein
MLEDQLEERACLHALGLLDEAEARAFLAETTGNEELRRTVTDLEETLTRLSLAATSIQHPTDELRHRLLERIENEPARVTTDPNGLIETINPAFTRLCGYRLEELRGRKPGHLLQGAATDPAAVETLRRAVREGIPCEVTLVNYHKNGSPYRVHIAIQPIRNANGHLLGFAAAEREIRDPAA